jgi:aconitate hydratase
MGVLPLQFMPGESAASLGLSGRETYTIHGLAEVGPKARLGVVARADDSSERRFTAIARLDGDIDVGYFRQGGILPAVLRRLAAD